VTSLRSLVFVAWLYLSMALFAVGLSPALVMPYRQAMWVIRGWSRFCLFGLRWIAGVKVEFRGLEHMPVGAALIAGKHQSMLDVIAPFAILPDNCFIMKKELMPLPFFGWFARKTNMIAVDRSAHSKALKDMVRQARARFAEGRQILIFPEGTRAPVGAPADYKPGIAALYRDLDCPCTPMATNSGVHWPAHGFRRYPGTVVYEFLPAIPAGLKRDAFMSQLEERLEGASNALRGLPATATRSMPARAPDPVPAPRP
jgi:1-acyl-sn-glycerol-3-phosphate acyltransferase